MPLHQIISINSDTKIYVWKITETFDELFRAVALKDISLARVEKMKAESHQRGFLAVRKLLEVAGYDDFDLQYDDSGKPRLEVRSTKYEVRSEKRPEVSGVGSEKLGDGSMKYEEALTDNRQPTTDNLKPTPDFQQQKTPRFQLPASISKHISISHSHKFSAIAISDQEVGIDLEILKEKTLKVATRYMDVSHLENLEVDEKIKKATVIWGIKEAVFKIKNEEGISFKDHIFEDDFSILDKKCVAKLHINDRKEHFDVQFDFIENYVLVIAFEQK